MQDFPIKTAIRTDDSAKDRSLGGAQFLKTEERMGVGARFLTKEATLKSEGPWPLGSQNEAAEQVMAEQRTQLPAELSMAEEAEIRKVARVRSEQVGRFHAAADALAAEEAKIAAVAEIRAQTDEEARIHAENLARQKAEEEASAAREAALLAAAAAAEAEAAKQAVDLAHEAPVTSEPLTQRMALGPAAAKVVKKIYRKSKRPRGSIRKVWFYTCEGERVGPVAFKDLRMMAADFSLNPRLDMIWREGMEMWRPAGEVDGLFERRNVRVESQPAVIAPLVYRQAPTARILMTRHSSWPGVRRPIFLVGSVLFPLVWHYLVATTAPNLSKEFGGVMMAAILPFAPLVPILLVIHLGLQRLVNLGMSRRWIFAIFVPILNFWLGYRCLVCPAGYAFHKKLDGAGIVLAILYGSILMLAGLALVAGIALLLEPATCPTQWLPLREMVRGVYQFFL